MNKYQYLILLPCAAFLNCFISAPGLAQGQLQSSIGSYNYGSAGAGWDSMDYNQNAVNPNSDVYGRSVYDPNYNHSALPVNRDSNSSYTANTPGIPMSNAQSMASINPAVTSNPYLPGFTNSSPLPNTSRRNLTPLNPNLGLGLPPTTLDSFVKESGMSNAIYGDEGGIFPPSAGNFSYISSGFDKKTKQGLTTGHGSKLPSAWGGDEFHGNEHSVSGPNYASSPLNGLLSPALSIPAN